MQVSNEISPICEGSMNKSLPINHPPGPKKTWPYFIEGMYPSTNLPTQLIKPKILVLDVSCQALWPEYFPVSGFVLAETGSVSFTVIVPQWWCFSMTGLISNVDKW